MSRLGSIVQSKGRTRRAAGFSYVEVLIATALMALMLAPALDGLSIGLLGARVHTERTLAHYHLASLVEEVLAQSFDELEAEAGAAGGFGNPTAYSDANGTSSRRLVYLAKYDLDNADGDSDRLTDPEDDFLLVRVEIEGTRDFLEALSVR